MKMPWQKVREQGEARQARDERHEAFARSFQELQLASKQLRSYRHPHLDGIAHTVLRAAGLISEELQASGNAHLLPASQPQDAPEGATTIYSSP